jgi:hypothetical protein
MKRGYGMSGGFHDVDWLTVFALGNARDHLGKVVFHLAREPWKAGAIRLVSSHRRQRCTKRLSPR